MKTKTDNIETVTRLIKYEYNGILGSLEKKVKIKIAIKENNACDIQKKKE